MTNYNLLERAASHYWGCKDERFDLKPMDYVYRMNDRISFQRYLDIRRWTASPASLSRFGS
eukprot:8337937-Prorocentrum_lima.AAC.1